MSRRRIAGIGIAVVIGLIVLIVLIRLGYDQSWTGFGRYEYETPKGTEVVPPKTVWDWMGFIAAALGGAAVAIYVQRRNTQRENLEAKREENNRQETFLQTYLDRMSVLITDKGLLKEERPEVHAVARARTVTALRGLDRTRQAIVLQFLYETGLANVLVQADLHETNLAGLSLSHLNLTRANLSGANLSGAFLIRANLSDAILRGARYNDKTTWPDGFDPEEAGAVRE